MFQHILVPLDGSFRAEQALPVAARIARATGGSLLLIRATNPPIDYSSGLYPGVLPPVPLMAVQLIESELAIATDYLKAASARPILAGIGITTEALFGTPAQELIKTADARGIDLIVLSSRGRTGFARWALGSVAHTLIHQSAVPVLVLHQDDALAYRETARPLCTLVPLDGSKLAEAALAPAAALTSALATPAQGMLHLAQVVKASPDAKEAGSVSEQHEAERMRARSYLAAIAERMRATEMGHTLAITTSVELASDVASALLDVAEREGDGICDLIAISTHGRGGLERWVMGSVTELLLNTTRLPMLIVRPQRNG